jgi:hypothetical protein
MLRFKFNPNTTARLPLAASHQTPDLFKPWLSLPTLWPNANVSDAGGAGISLDRLIEPII